MPKLGMPSRESERLWHLTDVGIEALTLITPAYWNSTPERARETGQHVAAWLNRTAREQRSKR